MQKIVVPALGESISEASIKSLTKKVGESIKQDEVIALLETDKVTIEVCSPCNGTVSSLNVKEGDTVLVEALIASIDETNVAPTENNKPSNEPIPTSLPTNESGKKDSPAAKVIMQEMNIARPSIDATGKDGRVTKEDVIKFTENQPNAPTLVAPSSMIDNKSTSQRVERVERMSKLRQRIAQRLKESQNTAAILTTFNEIDMTNVMAIRGKYKDLFEKKYAVKLGFMSFFVRAVVLSLQEFPAINAEIKNNDFIFKDYCDVGVAVGTPNGLVVPIMRNAELLSLAEIERTITNLGVKAKEGKLLVKDMEGGTFTITNGGIYGSLMSTPILNPPQSGILGMHAIQKRPMVTETGEIKARSMMYVALSYDHRIVDGKEAVTFLVRIKNYIENPERLLLNV